MSQFMGGGNSSQTATQAAPARREESKQGSSESSFKAFKGKGTALGSEISSTKSKSAPPKKPAAQNTTDLEAQRTRNLQVLEQIQRQREERKEGEVSEDLIPVEATTDAKKKAADDKGDYHALNATNSQY